LDHLDHYIEFFDDQKEDSFLLRFIDSQEIPGNRTHDNYEDPGYYPLPQEFLLAIIPELVMNIGREIVQLNLQRLMVDM